MFKTSAQIFQSWLLEIAVEQGWDKGKLKESLLFRRINLLTPADYYLLGNHNHPFFISPFPINTNALSTVNDHLFDRSRRPHWKAMFREEILKCEGDFAKIITVRETPTLNMIPSFPRGGKKYSVPDDHVLAVQFIHKYTSAMLGKADYVSDEGDTLIMRWNAIDRIRDMIELSKAGEMHDHGKLIAECISGCLQCGLSTNFEMAHYSEMDGKEILVWDKHDPSKNDDERDDLMLDIAETFEAMERIRDGERPLRYTGDNGAGVWFEVRIDGPLTITYKNIPQIMRHALRTLTVNTFKRL